VETCKTRTIVRAVLKKQEASPDLLQIGRGAVTADEMAGILVHVLGAALRARRKRGHGGVLELLFLLGF
jgi:hypothetical protein